MKWMDVGKDKAYKLMNELRDAGHLHRVAFRDVASGNMLIRHAVTEEPFPRDNPKEIIILFGGGKRVRGHSSLENLY